MKILKSSELWFEVTGVIAPDIKRSTFLKALAKNVVFLLVMGPFLLEITTASIYHHFNELEKSIIAIMLLLGGVMSVGKYSCLRLKNEAIKKLISDCQGLFDAGTNLGNLFCERINVVNFLLL